MTTASAVRTSTLALIVLTVGLVVPTMWLAVANRGVVVDAPLPAPTGAFLPLQLLSAVVWSVAALVMLRRPEIGWATLCALAALGHGVSAVGFGWAVRVFAAGAASAGGDIAVWLVTWALPIEVLALNWMAMTLPDGRLPNGRLRWLSLAVIGATTTGLLAGMVSELDVADSSFARATNPLGGGLPLSPVLPALLLAPTALVVLAIVCVRWRASVGEVRVAMRRIVVISVAGLAVPLLFLVRPEIAVGVAQVIGAIQVLAMLSVVLRHRLFGIDTVLERTVLYTLLTGVLLTVYVALVAAGDALFNTSIGPFAATAVALAALPAHRLLSRVVARFMYGDRDQPQRVVSSVMRSAGLAAPPQDMMHDVVNQIANGLRLNRIVVRHHVGGRPVIEIGSDGSAEAESFDLVHRGRLVGVLDVEPRSGEDELAPADRAALEELCDHVAAIFDAATSAIALRESRDRLVQVREEERRRLRRDLHDGLGPLLTGVALSIDAARNVVHAEPDTAAQILQRSRTELTSAIDEIRRLVENLRPPALDELGLVGSIRQHATRFPQLDVRVDRTGEMSRLPAAVEVAAYRIVTEAVTNTARHAAASTADVRFDLNGALEITITDDGRSTRPWTPGVGITSMIERAAELGGTITAGPASGGGGSIVAILPVEP